MNVFVVYISFDYKGVDCVHTTLEGAKKTCEEDAEQELTWHDYPDEDYYYCDPVNIDDDKLSYTIREYIIKE